MDPHLNLDLSTVLPLALISLFTLNYRDSIRTALRWGALRHDTLQGVYRWVTRLGIVFGLLFALPVLALVFFLGVIKTFDPSGIRIRMLSYPLYIFAMSLFPQAAKNVWLLIARRQEAWLRNAEDLPTDEYATLATVLFGVLPLVLSCAYVDVRYDWFVYGFVQLEPDFWRRLFLVGYLSEGVVLWQIGKDRGLFRRQPRWPLSIRMILSFLCTIYVPLIFGIFAYNQISAMPSVSSWRAFAYGTFCIFLWWSFPFGCGQSWLLVVRRLQWTEDEDVVHGHVCFWWLCLLFFVIVPAVTLAIMLTVTAHS